MARKRTLLFLQLPQLDIEVRGPHENVPLAAHYLRHAAAQAGELEHYDVVTLPAGAQEAGNRALVDSLDQLAPDVIAATLYLWNIERTLRVLAALRRLRPRTLVAAGGPELARPHPFALRSRVLDAAAAGEGEPVFPAILRRFRGAAAPHFDSVAWLDGARYTWGRTPVPGIDLPRALPPPADAAWQPDARGMAYLETSRGCPLRCTYCRYHHLRHGVSFLTPRDVVRRIEILRRRGAREIRFVDPTFNAHPQFDAVLEALVALNRDRAVAFFAEIRADQLTPGQVEALARAGFTDVEVGMQSRDPRVLRTIQRPTRFDRLDANVRRLGRSGVRVTLDVMYGLPGQTVRDVRTSLRWAARQPRTNVQCLQTLLLPGTDLRAQRRRWGIQALPVPPYAVTATAAMPPREMAAVERLLARDPNLPSDIRTRRFVGRALPDLFPERVAVAVPAGLDGGDLQGRAARRAVVFRGGDLAAHRKALADWAGRAVREEPDMLWQFVLAPRAEEPLDLLDALIAALRRAPSHIADRYAAARTAGLIVSRRVFVLLPRRRFDPSWVQAAEALLAEAFF